MNNFALNLTGYYRRPYLAAFRLTRATRHTVIGGLPPLGRVVRSLGISGLCFAFVKMSRISRLPTRPRDHLMRTALHRHGGLSAA